MWYDFIPKEDVMTELKRINRLLTGIEGVFHQVALGNHLSDSAMHILYTVSYFGEPCPIREIVASTGISKQTINSSLRKLESEGILYLQHNGGREKQVCLTPTGRDLAAKTGGRLAAIENEIFSSWSREEWETYLALTQRYLTTLEQKTKELPHETEHSAF